MAQHFDEAETKRLVHAGVAPTERGRWSMP